MSSQGRRLDHWTTSLDAVEALRVRMAEVTGAAGRSDHAAADGAGRAREVLELHRAAGRDGHVLDVNPAALIAGGVDRAEVIGLPLWTHRRGGRAPAPESARTLRARGRRGRRGPLRPLRRRRAHRGRAAAPPARSTCCCARCAAATARWRSSSPRAGRSPTASASSSGWRSQNAELSALTQRLARVHDYRERLLGELSHDLRAPLQVVITRAEQVLRTRARRRAARASW